MWLVAGYMVIWLYGYMLKHFMKLKRIIDAAIDYE